MVVSDPGVSYAAVTAPGAWPLLGHLPQMTRDSLGFIVGLAARGDIVDVKIGPARMSVVYHPDLVDRMLRDEQNFDKGGMFYDRGREFVGNGLATCPHAEHRRQRRLVQPAFRISRLSGYADVMVQQAAAEAARWVDGQTLDVMPAMARMTSQILARCLFSRVESDTTTSVFIDTVDELISLTLMRILTPLWLDWAPMPGKRRFAQAAARLREVSTRIIAERRQAADTDRGDLLSALLAARDEDGTALSEDELVDQITTLYIGGSETTADTLAWMFYLLACHPEVERRLHDELDAVLAGRPATYQDLPKLAYTRQVIDETLRLYAPGWILTRITTADTDLGGHRIPAGRVMIYSPYLIHRQSSAYADPTTFNPDRWADRSSGAPGTGYIPFGTGARKCIGDTFSLIETTLALATIAARWRLVTIEEMPFRLRVRAAVLAPRGLRLRVEQRHQISA